MTTLASPPFPPTTTSSVVAGVGWALAQNGSADMSMCEGFGGVPSNFTSPDNEAGGSAERAEPGEIVYNKNAANNPPGRMSARVLFFIAKFTFRPRYWKTCLARKRRVVPVLVARVVVLCERPFSHCALAAF